MLFFRLSGAKFAWVSTDAGYDVCYGILDFHRKVVCWFLLSGLFIQNRLFCCHRVLDFYFASFCDRVSNVFFIPFVVAAPPPPAFHSLPACNWMHERFDGSCI